MPSVFAIGEGTDGIVFNAAANNPNAVSGINHACFTIENFDTERVMAILIEHGLEPIEKRRPCAHQAFDVPGEVAATGQQRRRADESLGNAGSLFHRSRQ
jgi:hypothetical protein